MAKPDQPALEVLGAIGVPNVAVSKVSVLGVCHGT